MPATDALNRELAEVLAQIRNLGLESHVVELDALGLTVVPPEKVAEQGFAAQLQKAVLQLAAARTGISPDLKSGTSHAELEATAGQRGEMWLWRVLLSDPVFEQALMNPVALALITYLLGMSAKLSSSSALIKGPVVVDEPPKPLNLHSDNRGIPAPFPVFSQVANATWALTDYDLENGCVGYVPGSHLLCRQPTPDENLEAVVPVQARAGSLIVWHGNTWHGPYPRTAPGLRVSLLFYFCREYLAPQERYRDEVCGEILERNPPRMATLLGLDDPYGWDESGPDMSLLTASRSGDSRHS